GRRERRRHTMKPVLVAGVVGLVVLMFALAPMARATAGIRLLGEPSVANQFPDALVFSLEAESEAEIREVRVRYTFVPDNRPFPAEPKFDPGAHIRATFTLRSGTSQLYIPPGKTIRYSWELHDAAGNELTTPEVETTFADPRFKW